jgi:hypothetical protein
MNMYALVALILLCSSLGFVYGLTFANFKARHGERAWTDGYAAGLAKADEVWPTVVRRWEM